MTTQLVRPKQRTQKELDEHHKKMRRWQHNSFHGHCVMMLAQLQAILRSDSITPEARNAAENALTEIDSLAYHLETRVDHE